jgi:hypothetical protein
MPEFEVVSRRISDTIPFSGAYSTDAPAWYMPFLGYTYEVDYDNGHAMFLVPNWLFTFLATPRWGARPSHVAYEEAVRLGRCRESGDVPQGYGAGIGADARAIALPGMHSRTDIVFTNGTGVPTSARDAGLPYFGGLVSQNTAFSLSLSSMRTLAGVITNDRLENMAGTLVPAGWCKAGQSGVKATHSVVYARAAVTGTHMDAYWAMQPTMVERHARGAEPIVITAWPVSHADPITIMPRAADSTEDAVNFIATLPRLFVDAFWQSRVTGRAAAAPALPGVPFEDLKDVAFDAPFLKDNRAAYDARHILEGLGAYKRKAKRQGKGPTMLGAAAIEQSFYDSESESVPEVKHRGRDAVTKLENEVKAVKAIRDKKEKELATLEARLAKEVGKGKSGRRAHKAKSVASSISDAVSNAETLKTRLSGRRAKDAKASKGKGFH